MSSERQLIERVRRKIPSRAGGALRLGIGDDAAIIRVHAAHGAVDWVLTTDAFLEGVHFILRVHPAQAVGYKALARATSDLAAMGALPQYFFMNLAIPWERTGKWLDGFLAGMARAARAFGLVLAGGDTTRQSRIAINLTVLGSIAPGQAVRRSGAKPGDAIFVSGRLGQAELGLRLIELGLHKKAKWKKLLHKHFYPEPRLALGRLLARNKRATSSLRATSMIDISDGLSTDLGNLCDASGVGARIWPEKIPKVVVPDDLRKLKFDPLRLALDGGDDYELLFTVPRRVAKRLPKKLGGVPIARIGEITREKRIMLVDQAGKVRPLEARGWDPFRSRR